MPESILLFLMVISFFVPQIAAVGVVATIKNEIFAVVFGALTFVILLGIHISLAAHSYEVEPSWWTGGDGFLPLLYIPATLLCALSVGFGAVAIEDKLR